MARASLGSAVIALAALAAGAAAWADPPSPPSSRDFVMAASQSDTFEILEAQTALTQTTDPQVRAFAQQMVQDHTRLRAALGGAAERAGLAPPSPGLSGDQQKTLGALQSLRGHDFDRTYAKQQTLAHDEALVVERSYAMGGSSPDLRQAAQTAIPLIRNHLAMAEQLHAALPAQ